MKRTPLNRIGRKTRKWIAFRGNFLDKRKNGWGSWNCEHCFQETHYPEVDHIKKRSTNPELVFDESNLQVLCHACHQRKTDRQLGIGHHAEH